jgi:uncharacterized damage-inducible protein DinB
MDTTLVELFRHNQWANLRLLAACSDLSEEQLDASAAGTYGHIADTLVHILAAEEPYSIRAVVPLVQAIHHATEHRTQVLTILSQLGIEPPDLSGWAFGDAMGY